MAYAAYSCSNAGQQAAILESPVPVIGGNVKLVDGEDAFLPVLQNDDWYYATMTDPCGNCERVKIVATPAADTITLVRIANTGACFPSGSTILYDGSSPDAINAMVQGRLVSAASPLSFDTGAGALTLDITALEKELPGLLLNADAPLQYDSQSGTLSLDVDTLSTTLLTKMMPTILSKFSATAPLTYDGSGVFAIDIAALKTALGITT